MGVLHVSRVAVGMEVRISDELVEQNVGYLPWVLGESLATQVTDHVERESVGYFPALDFFRSYPDDVDPALLLLTDEVASFCTEYAKRELRRGLLQVFSNTRVENAHCLAFAMPRVRPGQPLAHEKLASHFAPREIKLDLILSTIEKSEDAQSDKLAAQRIIRSVRGSFGSVDILTSRVL